MSNANSERRPDTVMTIHHGDGTATELRGTGYAVRAAAHIAQENIADALWALEVMNRFGHLVEHAWDQDVRLRAGQPTLTDVDASKAAVETLPIAPDLAVYDRALAAISNARRLHDQPRSDLEERKDARIVAYHAISDVTRAASFRDAAEAADADEGLLMKSVWSDRYLTLAFTMEKMRQNAARLPEADLAGTVASHDTPVSAAVDRAVAILAEARRLMDANRHDPRRVESTPAWYPFEADLSDLRVRSANDMGTAAGLEKVAREVQEWSDHIRELGGNEDVAAKLDESAAVLVTQNRLMASWTQLATVNEVAALVDGKLDDVRARYEGTDEDSYGTRTELRDKIGFLSKLSWKIKQSAKTGVVDLSSTFEDYQDPEAEAEEHHDAMIEGREWFPAAERAQAGHERRIAGVQSLLDRLTNTGISVRTEFIVVYPKEHTEEVDEQMEQDDDGPGM